MLAGFLSKALATPSSSRSVRLPPIRCAISSRITSGQSRVSDPLGVRECGGFAEQAEKFDWLGSARQLGQDSLEAREERFIRAVVLPVPVSAHSARPTSSEPREQDTTPRGVDERGGPPAWARHRNLPAKRSKLNRNRRAQIPFLTSFVGSKRTSASAAPGA